MANLKRKEDTFWLIVFELSVCGHLTSNTLGLKIKQKDSYFMVSRTQIDRYESKTLMSLLRMLPNVLSSSTRPYSSIISHVMLRRL